MANVLVTGGAGFIGSNLVDKLIELKHTVYVVDDLSTGKKEYVNKKASLVKLDLADKKYLKTLKVLMQQANIELVYHVAALPRVEPSILDPFTSHRINIDATMNLLQAMKETGVKKIVFSSSSSVYGQPVNVPTTEAEPLNAMSPYALHKQIGEEYLKLFSDLYGFEATCLRYFNVYGNRQPTVGSYVPVIGIWMDQLKQGKPVTITGTGKQVRDFVCVDDVVQANIKAGFEPKQKKFAIYNVGSGTSYNLMEIAQTMLHAKDISFLPERIEPKLTQADISLITKELGFEPKVKLKEWIEEQNAN